jgi:hypothetical protein
MTNVELTLSPRSASDMKESGESDMRRAPFKRCGCGLVYSRAAWGGLPKVGTMSYRGERVELRQCACCSTIAALVEAMA